MLNIVQSNRMEALLSQLLTHLDAHKPASIFAEQTVLVQSPGMSQWLTIHLAHQQGVCAQVAFPLPSSFIWRLYQTLLPNVPEQSAFNKANMAWKLFELLPSLLADDDFAPLANYLANTHDLTKRFALCEKIADVFDQYLMYRPEWVLAWEQGEQAPTGLADDDADLRWQSKLWQALFQTTQDKGQSHYHRANLHQGLLQAIEHAEQSQLPERLDIFGISAIPRLQLDVFSKLAERIDVNLYFFNPSPHYWGDVVDEKTRAKIDANYALKPELDKDADTHFFVGNPLLSSFGKLGRDYLEQLIERDAQWHDAFKTDFAENALGVLQQEIHDLAFKGRALEPSPLWYVSEEGKIPLSLSDSSIQFATCHSALREVEALHDYLLTLLSKDKTLTPKDIIVMMPDVASYAPLIDAVFGRFYGTEKAIPYAIADRTVAEEKPVLQSFLTLSQLPTLRFGKTEMLDLLLVPAISERFDLTQHDLTQISVWLDEVAVKWGFDGEHKASLGQAGLPLNTWHLGIQRLVLGAHFSADDAYNGIYGHSAIEGRDTEVAGALLAFLAKLNHYKNKLSKAQSLASFATHLTALADDFYQRDDALAREFSELDNAIATLQTHYEQGDYQGEVDAALVHKVLEGALSQQGVGQRFLIGRVNFCTLMPMRAVPFKQVCLLGMNDADYPRNVVPTGFDLLNKTPRQKGDRSRKLDDRYLFLEALLSARDALYISYVGNSCVDNSVRLPSLLVSELMDTLSRVFYLEGDNSEGVVNHLTRKHHLQPFHPDYYTDSALQSYDPTWLSDEVNASSKDAAVATDGMSVASQFNQIDDVIFGLTKAQRCYFERVLGIKLDNLDAEAEDDEPFVTDHLTRYQIFGHLVQCALNDTPVDEAQLLQQGALPHGQGGKLTLNAFKEQLTPFIETVRALLPNERNEGALEVNLHFALSSGDFNLQGWLSVYQNQQLLYRPADLKGKDLISAYIQHLCANAITPTNTALVALNQHLTLAPMAEDVAREQLMDLLELYISAHQAPLPFIAQTSYSFATKGQVDAAKLTFNGGYPHFNGEGKDAYVSAAFPNDDIIAQSAFQALSERVYRPILNACEVTEL